MAYRRIAQAAPRARADEPPCVEKREINVGEVGFAPDWARGFWVGVEAETGLQIVRAVADSGEPLLRRNGVDIAFIAWVNVAENVEKYQIQHGLGPSQMWDAV